MSLKLFIVLSIVVLPRSSVGLIEGGTALQGGELVAKAVDSYVRLRLADADWNEYSKFITWPDEPSWDCHWVTRAFRVGRAEVVGNAAKVSVTYDRVGVFCGEFEFTAGRKSVITDYELVKSRSGWKVDGPIPDYPDMSIDTLLRKLKARAQNAKETPDRRSKFDRVIREVLKAKT